MSATIKLWTCSAKGAIACGSVLPLAMRGAIEQRLGRAGQLVATAIAVRLGRAEI